MGNRIGDVMLRAALVMMIVVMVATIFYSGNDTWGYTHKAIYLITLSVLGIQFAQYAIRNVRLKFERKQQAEGRHWLNLLTDEKPVEREYIPAAMRRFIMERDAFICSYCQTEGEPDLDPDGLSWHIDHVMPVSRGGKTVPQNLTLSCTSCNLAKGAKTPVEFMKIRQKQGRWKRWDNSE